MRRSAVVIKRHEAYIIWIKGDYQESLFVSVDDPVSLA